MCSPGASWRYHARITIIYYEIILYFFPNRFFQKNLFRRVFYSKFLYIIVLIDNAQFSSINSQYSLGGICLSGGNYFRGKVWGEGTIFWGQFSSKALKPVQLTKNHLILQADFRLKLRLMKSDGCTNLPKNIPRINL